MSSSADIASESVNVKPSPVVENKPQSLYSRYVSWRKSFGLPQPGAFEQLHGKVRDVFVNNYMFDGAKLDISKGLSPNFQVTHSLSMGSQVMPQSYTFGTFVGGDNGFLNGNMDSEGSLSARGAYPVTKNLTGKFQLQLGVMGQQGALQLETDYTGIDYSLNFKAVNPNPQDLTGIYVGSYLQSITKSLALGGEVALQHPTVDIVEPQVSAVGKLSLGDGILTATYSLMGVVQTTYHHKVSDKIELGAELQYVAVQNRREAICTLGGKWEFRAAAFRGQIDTNGRVSSVLEQRLAPGISLFFCSDLDHLKGSSKFGVGMQLQI